MTDLASTPGLDARSSRRSGIDWMRAIAVVGVMLFHGNQAIRGLGTLTGTGWVGVDIFFALSGYLVTRTWLRNPDLVSFLRKRAWRVLPAYLVVLAAGYGVCVAISGVMPDYIQRFWHQLPYYIGFYANAPGLGGLVLGPLWSISAEVHLWLTIPLLSSLVARGSRSHPWLTLAALLAVPIAGRGLLVAMSPQVVASWGFPDISLKTLAFGEGVYQVSVLHADAFLVGLWIAVQGTMVFKKRHLWIGLGLGTAAILLGLPFKTYAPRPVGMVLFQFTGLAFGAGALLLWARQTTVGAPAPVLWLSDRIYSLYLAQSVVALVLTPVLQFTRTSGLWPQVAVEVAFAGLSLTSGALLYRLIEAPVLRWGAPSAPSTVLL